MKTTLMQSTVKRVNPLVTSVYVRFGRQSYHCQRNGICEIKEVTNYKKAVVSGRAAFGYLMLEGQGLQLRLSLPTMSVETQTCCFGHGILVVEEDFIKEIFFNRSYPVTVHIRKGVYPVKREADSLTIWFLPDSVVPFCEAL